MSAKRDWTKLDEAILHVAAKSAGDETFGSVKLNKILFYADFESFATRGESITGEDYIKQPFGPVPCHAEKRISKLEQAGRATLVERKAHGYRQKVLIHLDQPNLDELSGSDVALLDRVIERFRDLPARDVSDLSHRFIGWRAAEVGEKIPYSTALVAQGAPTLEKLGIAEALAGELGKSKAAR